MDAFSPIFPASSCVLDYYFICLKNYLTFLGNQKKILLLGDMLELGRDSKRFHKALSKKINKTDIDKVFVYGKYIKETFNSLSKNKRGNKKKGMIFKNLNQANKCFSNIVDNNDILMIKGSNATGLNKFSKTIKEGQLSAL